MPQEEHETGRKGGVGIKEREDQSLKRPPMYRVIILNDDFTPIDFVVQLVSGVFRKSPEEAARITLEVHTKGAAIAGTYTHEIAETKVAISVATAKKYEHPLQLTMEPES